MRESVCARDGWIFGLLCGWVDLVEFLVSGWTLYVNGWIFWSDILVRLLCEWVDLVGFLVWRWTFMWVVGFLGRIMDCCVSGWISWSDYGLLYEGVDFWVRLWIVI